MSSWQHHHQHLSEVKLDSYSESQKKRHPFIFVITLSDVIQFW